MIDTDAAQDLNPFPPALADFHAAADCVAQRDRLGVHVFRGNALTVDLDGEPHPAHGRIDAPQPGRVPGPVGFIEDDADTVVGQMQSGAIAGRGHILARRGSCGRLPGGHDPMGTIGPCRRSRLGVRRRSPIARDLLQLLGRGKRAAGCPDNHQDRAMKPSHGQFSHSEQSGAGVRQVAVQHRPQRIGWNLPGRQSGPEISSQVET